MKLLNPESLSSTIENINDLHFFEIKSTKKERYEAAEWISSRCGLDGSYSQLPAPTKKDFKNKAKVFTGEETRPWASTAHIMGEEAMRAFYLLNVESKSIGSRIQEASDNMFSRIRETEKVSQYKGGMYCCGICTVSYWRHLLAGGFKDHEKYLSRGINALKDHRDGKSRWKRFPFYYTLAALNEMAEKSISPRNTLAELRYAAPSIERVAKRKSGKTVYDKRREKLLSSILSRI